MVSAGSKTPVSMIMAGILQIRDGCNRSFQMGNYYEAAWLLAQMAALLPIEAYKAGFKLPDPPTAGKQDKITPDIQRACREYFERHNLYVNAQIPKYVYQYFERGRQMKTGY